MIFIKKSDIMHKFPILFFQSVLPVTKNLLEKPDTVEGFLCSFAVSCITVSMCYLHGIQYRANGQWVLYSEHHGKGYTSSLTFRIQRSDGSEVEKLHTAWTQKGRKFLYHTLKRRGVLPLAEQGD